VSITAPRLVDSPPAEIDRIFEAQQRNRAAVAATTAAQRIAKLKRFERFLLERRDEIRAAMWEDYRKPAAEVDLSEIYPVVSECRHAARHLRKWMKPKRVSTRLALFGARSSIVYEPKGVVLIIAPWNFPFNLTLGPLVSAIAAGNCAVLKPSELTPASTACMKRLIGELFDESEVALVEGDARVSEELLRRKFDHIFFTGSPAVGKLVMKAAAEHLTSVTLELGGKSPAIVDATANVAGAAKKIAWGKFLNCGQVCIAPDYALVHESVRDEFLSELQSQIASRGDAAQGWIVNERHAARVKRLIDTAVGGGARVVTGGTTSGREIAPTVHFYELELPFGGVGHSGVGKSHGFHGFEAFSNARGLLDQKLPFSAIELLYPPYRGKLKQFLIDFTVRWL
jgi:aldehyde dehydrogenase (NAD+)